MSAIMQKHLSDEVLDRVMALFWTKGLFNTSIDDLVKSTGLNRSAIYKYFGGKGALFVEMLKRYQQKVTATLLAPLKKNDANVFSIQEFFNQFIRLKQQGCLSSGCLLVATASELPSHTEMVSSLISDFHSQLQQLFEAAITRSKANGVLAEFVNSRSVADFLASNIFGLMTLSRASAPLSMLKNQVDEIIYYLDSLKQPRKCLE